MVKVKTLYRSVDRRARLDKCGVINEAGRRTLDHVKTVQEAIGDPVQDCLLVVNTRRLEEWTGVLQATVF